MTQAEVLSRYSGVRVLVLGATGFLGRGVVRLLAEARADLHCGIRTSNSTLPHGVVVHLVDLASAELAANLVQALKPTILFNLAGYGVDPGEKQGPDEDLAHRLNGALPEELARSIGPSGSEGWVGRQLVHVGSIAEYGAVAGVVTEGTEPRPTGLYAVSKLRGSVSVGLVARQTGVRALTARLAQVYGPGEHPGRLLPQLVAARSSGRLEPLTVGTQLKDFTFSGDVHEGLLRLGLSEGVPGECVNLATGQSHRVRDFAVEAARLLLLPPGILRFERPVPPDELSHDGVAVDRLRSLAAWVPPTTIPQGIIRTLEAGS